MLVSQQKVAGELQVCWTIQVYHDWSLHTACLERPMMVESMQQGYSSTGNLPHPMQCPSTLSRAERECFVAVV